MPPKFVGEVSCVCQLQRQAAVDRSRDRNLAMVSVGSYQERPRVTHVSSSAEHCTFDFLPDGSAHWLDQKSLSQSHIHTR